MMCTDISIHKNDEVCYCLVLCTYLFLYTYRYLRIPKHVCKSANKHGNIYRAVNIYIFANLCYVYSERKLSPDME